MTTNYLFGLLLLYCLTVTAQPNPLPGPPIFYKTNTYPSVCYLPPDSGACDTDEARQKVGKDAEKTDQKQSTRYYFDTVTEDCYPFAFMAKPCSKNKNNFRTKEECRSYCKLV